MTCGKTLVMAFGTFDLLHPGHLSYLRQAKKLGSRLVVVVARDSSVKRIKSRLPVYSERERLGLVSALKFVDRAVLGSIVEKDMLLIVKKMKPDIIALGYDQNPGNSELRQKLTEVGIKCKIRRMEAHMPKKHKSSRIRNRLFRG